MSGKAPVADDSSDESGSSDSEGEGSQVSREQEEAQAHTHPPLFTEFELHMQCLLFSMALVTVV